MPRRSVRVDGHEVLTRDGVEQLVQAAIITAIGDRLDETLLRVAEAMAARKPAPPTTTVDMLTKHATEAHVAAVVGNAVTWLLASDELAEVIRRSTPATRSVVERDAAGRLIGLITTPITDKG